MHDDGFGGSLPRQRMQFGGYWLSAAASHVPMAGLRNQGLLFFAVSVASYWLVSYWLISVSALNQFVLETMKLSSVEDQG